MNIDLKCALIRRYGSQLRAVKPLRIRQPRLSLLVQEHVAPTQSERERLKEALGADFFSNESEGPRAA